MTNPDPNQETTAFPPATPEPPTVPSVTPPAAAPQPASPYTAPAPQPASPYAAPSTPASPYAAPSTPASPYPAPTTPAAPYAAPTTPQPYGAPAPQPASPYTAPATPTAQPYPATPADQPTAANPYAVPPVSGQPVYGAPYPDQPLSATPYSVPPMAPPKQRRTAVLVLSIVTAFLFIASGLLGGLLVAQRGETSRANTEIAAQRDEITAKTKKLDEMEANLNAVNSENLLKGQELEGSKNDRNEQERQKKVVAKCLDLLMDAFSADTESQFDKRIAAAEKTCDEADRYM
ncbi:hypothetical protein [Asanoa siamensis]|uniref:Uncharacterized protein n=1 Tax=Asanoa siamensis TaxID=926357 RepID=A0ABQ4CP86_9ACTN|nr:hypothetical protein [Asanoa siamensis]GIF73106.1 hypothetical protein Asi02nite_26240 [Asanoa siamensis]